MSITIWIPKQLFDALKDYKSRGGVINVSRVCTSALESELHQRATYDQEYNYWDFVGRSADF